VGSEKRDKGALMMWMMKGRVERLKLAANNYLRKNSSILLLPTFTGEARKIERAANLG
jgi:hypothetical protein